MNQSPARALRACLAGLLLLTALGIHATPARAVEHQLPGLCNGRSDADTVVVAIANGKGYDTKLVLSLTTDHAGVPTGTLVLGQGSSRILVTDWCRMWLHVPGVSQGGACEDSDVRDDAVTAHAVGQGLLPDGSRILVRADVRSTDEGAVFRIRYREQAAHHAVVAVDEHDDDSCEGDWVRIPIEGWAPLRQLHVGPAEPS